MKKKNFVLVLVMILSAMVSAVPYYGWQNEYAGSEAGTMACWSFNQSTLGVDGSNRPTAADISGNGYTATLYSNPTGVAEFAAGGKWGYAIHMTSAGGSDDYITTPTATKTMFSTDQSLSIECWVKFDDLSATEVLIDKKYSDSGASEVKSGFQIRISKNEDKNRIWFSLGDGTVTKTIYVDLAWQTNAYYHIAATWDAATDTAKIFRDGVQIKQSDSTWFGFVPVLNNNYVIRMAQRLGSAYQPLRGYLDMVRISDTAYEFATPEPATMAILGLGSLMILARRK